MNGIPSRKIDSTFCIAARGPVSNCIKTSKPNSSTSEALRVAGVKPSPLGIAAKGASIFESDRIAKSCPRSPATRELTDGMRIKGGLDDQGQPSLQGSDLPRIARSRHINPLADFATSHSAKDGSCLSTNSASRQSAVQDCSDRRCELSTCRHCVCGRIRREATFWTGMPGSVKRPRLHPLRKFSASPKILETPPLPSPAGYQPGRAAAAASLQSG